MALSKKRKQELESENTKYCTECNKVKPLYDFHFHPTGRKFACSHCIDCMNKKYEKERYLNKTHGISLTDYDKLLEKQDGKCKICGTEKINNKQFGRFIIDHDHLTGKIRGLLCHNCNTLLGHSKDNTETLIAAVRYLIESRK